MKKILAAGALAATLALTACSPMEVWPLSIWQTDEQKLEALMLKGVGIMGRTTEGMTDAELDAKKDEFFTIIVDSCWMSDEMMMTGLGSMEDADVEQKLALRDVVLEAREIVCEGGDA